MASFQMTRATRIEAAISTKPIEDAMAVLQRDMEETLTGSGAASTIRLVMDPALPEEGYCVRVDEDAVTIAYRDDLGAVYGLYFLSEKFLGVQPFDFWNGRTAKHREAAEILCGEYASPTRAVRYRGWMINDEVLLDGWHDTAEDTGEMWRRIYETILRCGGNMVIPGTDRKDDGDELSFLALDMGLWLTQHHTELLGARMFARAYPGVQASYQQHPELFEALWRESVEKYAGRSVIWAVGYRGQGDCAFWTGEKGFDTPKARGEMIVRVVERQMALVREKDPGALFCTNLYGEMMELYRDGCLNLPPEVIKIWGDNGYGKMVNRRTNNENPRVPSMPPLGEPGQNGLYYHASFYDLQAANHITMSQNSPAMIEGELAQAERNGAHAYWNINVGSIKPHIYILDLIREVWTQGHADVQAHARDYARAYYGDARVAPLLLSFSEHTMPYGPNEDDRAADQYYHFVLRHLARTLMRGEVGEGTARLFWAAGEGSLFEQAERIGERCRQAVPGWEAYLAECAAVREGLSASGAQLLDDTLILQGKLHWTGCRALRDVCLAVESVQRQAYPEAYLYTDRALRAHREGVLALEAAEHDAFQNIYREECFSNVRLTVRALETLRGWLRACYDGEHFYDWERQYLFAPGDRNIWCLTHRLNQLTDDALCDALSRVIPISEA